jgi:hypothetical protein
MSMAMTKSTISFSGSRFTACSPAYAGSSSESMATIRSAPCLGPLGLALSNAVSYEGVELGLR